MYHPKSSMATQLRLFCKDSVNQVMMLHPHYYPESSHHLPPSIAPDPHSTLAGPVAQNLFGALSANEAQLAAIGGDNVADKGS